MTWEATNEPVLAGHCQIEHSVALVVSIKSVAGGTALIIRFPDLKQVVRSLDVLEIKTIVDGEGVLVSPLGIIDTDFPTR